MIGGSVYSLNSVGLISVGLLSVGLLSVGLLIWLRVNFGVNILWVLSVMVILRVGLSFEMIDIVDLVDFGMLLFDYDEVSLDDIMFGYLCCNFGVLVLLGRNSFFNELFLDYLGFGLVRVCSNWLLVVI